MSISSWDKEHIKNIERYASLIDKIYQSAVQEAASLSGVIGHFNKAKPFSFADYPETKKRVEKLLRKLQKEVKFVVLDGIESAWTLSNNKNNELCNVVFGNNKGKLTKEQERKYYATNDKARKAFELRKTAGLSLSERVWKYSDQFKQEIEMGLDIGLRDGLSAQEMSRDLKQYLKNPGKLFRRVRDEHGVLHLSKQAAAFHPGQGVYRSSYKNAMRLARTEVNMSYRTADHIRWQQLDFVVGIEIRLSNNHTLNGVHFYDICDELKGKYPKDFKFTGWHPQCRCHVVSILKSPTEMKADTQRILNRENPTAESSNRVSDVPDAFKKWVAGNKERMERSSSLPYFIRDNEKYITQMRITNAAAKGVLEAQAFNEIIIPKPTPLEIAARRHEARTPEQIEAIQGAWDDRRKELAQVNMMRSNLLSVAKGYPELSDKAIQALQTETNKQLIRDKAKKLSLDIVAAKKEEKRLSFLLDDVKGLKAKHGLKATQELYDAVDKKINTWAGLSPEELKKKLIYEIDYVKTHKKYITWEGAAKAYSKKLAEVETQILKQNIQDSISSLASYIAGTKSDKLKAALSELETMLKGGAPLDDVQKKAVILNADVVRFRQIKDAAARRAIRKASTADPGDIFSPSSYTKERKNKAMWAKTPEYADDKLRPVSGSVWKDLSAKQREAINFYTGSFNPLNEPLRGQPYVGNASKAAIGRKSIPLMTEAIEKSSYDFDMWVQRGDALAAFKGRFGVDLAGLTEAQAQQLIGREGMEKAFVSCGSSKGKGFDHDSVIFNIYVPKGTKCIYAEPFSKWGNGSGINWDGISKQVTLSSEQETILQRGTKFRITKIEKSGGKWYIDVDVIGQELAIFKP